MLLKVSNFKLAEDVIRKLCDIAAVDFVDAQVCFSEPECQGISIDGVKNIGHAIYKIIDGYIDNSNLIVGKSFFPSDYERDLFLITLSSVLRKFMYKDSDRFVGEYRYVRRVHQEPLAWVLLKDIICPLFNKIPPNIKLVYSDSVISDIAQFYKKEELPSEVSDEDIVFVNKVYNQAAQIACIIIESIKYMRLSPLEVMNRIHSGEIRKIFCSFIDIALDYEEQEDFFEMIRVNTGIDFSYSIKAAQSGGGQTPFWYLGLIESMLGGVRGGDWSTYNTLEKKTREFWEEVEQEKRKRKESGKDSGVPFDLLLRIKNKSKEIDGTPKTVTLQKLLSDNRIW